VLIIDAKVGPTADDLEMIFSLEKAQKDIEQKYATHAISKEIIDSKIQAEKLEHLKAQKEAHETAIQKQLAAVTEELQQMRKPWWKKWFLPRPAEDS
jgi:hypothetical protein